MNYKLEEGVGRRVHSSRICTDIHGSILQETGIGVKNVLLVAVGLYREVNIRKLLYSIRRDRS